MSARRQRLGITGAVPGAEVARCDRGLKRRRGDRSGGRKLLNLDSLSSGLTRRMIGTLGRVLRLAAQDYCKGVFQNTPAVEALRKAGPWS
jgi:hypothetical protein